MIEGRMKNPETSLPPGFRFHPTDEELILHYLRNKATSLPCPVSIIAEVDLYKFDPWDLPDKAAFGEKEWYFFSPRDRKYPNGARPNRSAASGYWKATGTDKPILGTGTGGVNGKESIGVKKALVFYQGRPPKGLKTNWIMHEYRLAQTPQRSMKLRDTSMRLDDWVLCRIYKKNSTLSTRISDREEEEDPSLEDVSFGRAPNFMNQSSSLQVQKSSSFSDLLAAADFSLLSRLLYDNPLSDSDNPAEPSPNFGHESLNQLVTNTTHHNINNNYNNYNNYNNNNNNNNNRYAASAQETGRQNQLKRERPAAATSDEDCGLHPSKKFNNPFIYAGFNDHSDATLHHLLNQPSPFFNQQLPLSSNLQF